MTFLVANVTTWGDRLALAGVSVLTVFVILLVLVLVLQAFAAAAKRTLAAVRPAHPTPLAEASELEKAAVATEVWLHFHEKHDLESGVLTIHNDHHKLQIL